MLMLDSGAHSLFKLERKQKDPFGYFETDEFWKYVDDYAKFIKKNISKIDVYINVDIIPNPELTWKTQRYLEDVHKLKPLPVFHRHTDFKWLKMYIDNYDYIGLAGIATIISKSTWVRDVGNPAFELICNTPNRMPRVKVHGFAIASPELMISYPWFSVDSASWVIYGKYGGVIIPKEKNGKYDYTQPPWLIKTSWRNWHIKKEGTHIDNITPLQRKKFLEYFESKGLSLGKSEYKKVPGKYKIQENESWLDKKKGVVEIIVERGLCNHYEERDTLNMVYFIDLEKNIPEWPWPWNKQKGGRFFI